MTKKVAVVTGSNKGVGFAIVRALCKEFDGDVFLTARDEGRGKEAVEALKKEGLTPLFHQLDINDASTVERLRDFLKKNYGGLDVLVNNAGIFAGNDPVQAEQTVKTNFFSTLKCCQILFPILKPHARVVCVSSGSCKGAVSKCSESMRRTFVDPNVKMEDLESLMTKFVEATKAGKALEEGFSESAYGMSKIGATVMCIIQQREMDAAGAEDIVINSCCPGWTATDLGGSKAENTIDEGAETPVYLALLPPNVSEPRGKFLQKKAVTLWNMDTKHGS